MVVAVEVVVEVAVEVAAEVVMDCWDCIRPFFFFYI